MREREREREKKGERERASPTRFLLRRAPKILPAGDRVTAHHCEGIRGGEIMQRREKTHRHRLPEENRETVCVCVCVCAENAQNKRIIFIDFLDTLGG